MHVSAICIKMLLHAVSCTAIKFLKRLRPTSNLTKCSKCLDLLAPWELPADWSKWIFYPLLSQSGSLRGGCKKKMVSCASLCMQHFYTQVNISRYGPIRNGVRRPVVLRGLMFCMSKSSFYQCTNIYGSRNWLDQYAKSRRYKECGIFKTDPFVVHKTCFAPQNNIA